MRGPWVALKAPAETGPVPGGAGSGAGGGSGTGGGRCLVGGACDRSDKKSVKSFTLGA